MCILIIIIALFLSLIAHEVFILTYRLSKYRKKQGNGDNMWIHKGRKNKKVKYGLKAYFVYFQVCCKRTLSGCKMCSFEACKKYIYIYIFIYWKWVNNLRHVEA